MSLFIQCTLNNKRFKRTRRLSNLVIKHKCVNFERDKRVAVPHHFRRCRYMDLRLLERVSVSLPKRMNRYSVSGEGNGTTRLPATVFVSPTVPHVPEFKPIPNTSKVLWHEFAEHGAHIHSLPHAHACLLKTSVVHVTTAQKLMGHADPGMTLGIYTRFRDEEIDNAGAAIMDSLRGKSDYLMF